jgi:DNA-binding response OmpR family regulator
MVPGKPEEALKTSRVVARAAASQPPCRYDPASGGTAVSDESPFVLVVDDDQALRSLLQRGLGGLGHDVACVESGRAALRAVVRRRPDLVILDLTMPDVDGMDVCRMLRRIDPGLPILMLTARDTINDRVAGLDAGADDYLVKPFAYEELAARLRALARRAESGPRRPDPVLAAGPIALDERSRSVTVDGRRVDLSPREFSLLECFLRHPGQSLTRDQLLDQAWPFSVAVTPNAVDAYVHYLRTKLGEAGRWIETVRGVGYRLADG